MEFIKFDGETYPKFQSEGNASQFAIPFAKHFCKGVGVDIGCHSVDWKFPGAYPVDPEIDPDFTAEDFPYDNLDYIYSSHCLEHLDSWVDALKYWNTKLKYGGTMFLYLPDYSQKYWRPWNNYKHKHILVREHITDFMIDELKYSTVCYSNGVDLNSSFMVAGIK